MIQVHEAKSGAIAGLAAVKHRIALAAEKASRQANDITLVAVSKTFGAAEIEPVIAAGQRVFGENRVQEARAKWPALKARHPGIELHLIGPLQTNKVREAVALFDCIQTVDRPKLVEALAAELRRQGVQRKLLVQVNTGHEAQKAGVAPDAVQSLLALCREAGLPISGLMCIPPADADPLPHFRLLREFAERHGLHELSMGMSGDFEAAIAEGATHVRVGSAIFGARDYPASG